MRRLYWLAVAVGVGSVPVACQPAAGQPPASPAPAQPAPWANKFFLPDIATNRDQPAPPVVTHNFGDVPHGTLCTHTFTITNIYDVPMQVVEVRKSCTCLDFAPVAKVLQPNDTADFTVTMNAGKFVGANTQTFYVTVGPKYVSTAVIRVSANSKTDVTVNPGAVAFGTVAPGAKASQSVKVEYKGRVRDWKVTEVVAAPQGAVTAQLSETDRGGLLRGGAEYLLTVSLKPNLAPGAIAEQITLRTNDPTNPLIQVSVTGEVAALLDVAPARVKIDGIAVGQSATQRVLIRAAKPFKVLGVDGAGAGVTVELPSAAKTALPAHVLTVKFDPAKPGAVSRDLTIKTDFNGGAAVTVPVEAEGVK